MQALILFTLLFVIFIIYIVILSFAKGFVKKILYSMLFTFIWAGDQIVAGVAMQYYCNKYSHVKIYEKPKDVKGFSSDEGISTDLFNYYKDYEWFESPFMENGFVMERVRKQPDGTIVSEKNIKSISKYQINYEESEVDLLFFKLKKYHWTAINRSSRVLIGQYYDFSPAKKFLIYFPIVFWAVGNDGRCHSVTHEVVDTVILHKYFFGH